MAMEYMCFVWCDCQNNRRSNRQSVGFAPDAAERPLSGGLLRRDTPHHLKQSRIRSEVNGQQVDDKLRQMIAKNPSLVQQAAPPTVVQPVASSLTAGPPSHDATSTEESTDSEVVAFFV